MKWNSFRVAKEILRYNATLELLVFLVSGPN